jgi:hypothetical protein
MLAFMSSSVSPPGDDPGNENGGSTGKRSANGGSHNSKPPQPAAAAVASYPGVKGGWFTESCLLWPGQRLSLALEVRPCGKWETQGPLRQEEDRYRFLLDAV